MFGRKAFLDCVQLCVLFAMTKHLTKCLRERKVCFHLQLDGIVGK